MDDGKFCGAPVPWKEAENCCLDCESGRWRIVCGESVDNSILLKNYDFDCSCVALCDVILDFCLSSGNCCFYVGRLWELPKW